MGNEISKCGEDLGFRPTSAAGQSGGGDAHLAALRDPEPEHVPIVSAECFECDSICPAVDLASALVSLLQSLFDGLIDSLLDLLADELANLFLDGFLNGRPLAVEGTVDVAGLFGPVLQSGP